MNDEMKTREQLINEQITIRKRVAEVDVSKDKQDSHNNILLKSDEIFRYFVENANDIVYSLTADGIFTYVSPNWTEILGHDIREVVGRSFEAFVHPEDIPICRAFMEQVIATGKKQAGVEYRVRHKTGAWRWHKTNASPVRDADGNILSYMGIGRDITDRKQAEEALRESEEQYRLVVENAGEAISVIQDGMMKFVNRRATDTIGYSKEELTSRPFIEFIHPDDRKMVLERYLKRMRNENVPPIYQFKVIAGDGTVKWAEIHATIVSWNGKPATLSFLIDITDRKRAEEALRASELTYQTIFENTGTTMLIIEEDMTISLANDGFENLTGYKREEVERKRKWTEFIEKDDLEKMITQHQLRRAGLGLAKKGYEFRLVHRDGHLKNILLTVDIIPGTKRSVASLMDITDRKQAEEALRESEEKYRNILENINDTYFEVDLQGNLTFCNEVLPTFMGYTREELYGMNYRAYMDSKTRKIIKDHFQDVYRGDMPGKVINYEVIKKDGTRAQAEASFSLRKNDDGQPVGFRGISRDVSERKRAEEALRESEKRYRSVIENIQDVFYRSDINGRLLMGSPSGAKMFGYNTINEMIGIPLDSFWPNPKERERLLAQIKTTGKAKDFEALLKKKDGTIFSASLTTQFYYDEDNNLLGTEGIIRDISERKRLEERLQRAEKMEALGTLAGGVAHDLNNVLGIIVGYSELLLDDIDESSKIRSRVINIMKGGERAAAIVQDLLTLARSGVQTRKVINLNTMINGFQESPEFMKLSSFHPGVQIETNLETDLLNITGSPVHLTKTFFNLVSNAVEAMPEGGKMSIRTINEYLDRPVQGYDDVREGDYVVLSVSDTGEGIPAADLKRIFEPFYTKKVMGRSGTGLGLAVVWGTMKDHNGYINVQSEEKKGTTFTLYFPVTREGIFREQVSVSVSEYMGDGESVLVVDDVEGQRDLAAQMLKKLNYTVSTVSSGEEAVEYVKKNKVDIIVLDMIMDPGIDGLDTYKKILELNPKQKAIIVSGFSETDRVSEAQSLGAGAYVRKPYVLERLGLAVRKELDK